MGTLSPRLLCMHAFPIYFRDAHDEGSCWMLQNDSMMGKLRTWNMTSLGLVLHMGASQNGGYHFLGLPIARLLSFWGLY